MLGYHREASSAGALESGRVGLGRARPMSLEGKSQASPRLELVGGVVTARSTVPVFILPLLHPKRGLRFPDARHPTPSLVLNGTLNFESRRF